MQSLFMRFPEGKEKAVTFSYDDGVVQDKRLAEIFDRYGMKGTFNFNNLSHRKVNFTNEEIREYFISKGHEIAIHNAHHRSNGNLRPIEGIREVLDCRMELEERCGCIIRGMAYPNIGIRQMGSFGTYEQIKQYLTELDIAYGRSLGSDNDRFMLPEDFHNWMPSAHHANPKIMEYIDKFLALDLSALNHSRRVSRLLYIWGHSYEFDQDDNWDHMENICQKLSHNPNIWYATNIEIYDYVQAFKSLRYSADGRMIYNPTLIPMWLWIDKKIICIQPGETVTVE